MRARWLALLGGLGHRSAAPAAAVPDGPPTLLPLFDVQVDPMRRLLLIHFEQDPDTTYQSSEPQVFDDPVNGAGHLIRPAPPGLPMPGQRLAGGQPAWALWGEDPSRPPPRAVRGLARHRAPARAPTG